MFDPAFLHELSSLAQVLLVDITLAGDNAVEAMLYRMNREGYAVPPEEYLAIIREGYRDFNLPEPLLDAAVELSARLKPTITGLPRRPGFH